MESKEEYIRRREKKTGTTLKEREEKPVTMRSRKEQRGRPEGDMKT